MPRAKLEDAYRSLARRRGFAWIGPFPQNTKARTRWRCARGHLFEASYNNVDQGMNCKHCAREHSGSRQRHGPEDYHALATERGFRWLGPPVTSALAPTVWDCGQGHRWSARY